MNGHEFASEADPKPNADGEADIEAAPAQDATRLPGARTRQEVQEALAWHRAETERLRVLVDFLSRPIHAHGGADPDPDIVTAYNLAVEAALIGIRHGAQGSR